MNKSPIENISQWKTNPTIKGIFSSIQEKIFNLIKDLTIIKSSLVNVENLDLQCFETGDSQQFTGNSFLVSWT